VAGYDYLEFVGTGIVATAVLFSSAFPGIFSTLVKWKFQRTYDAILAAPVGVAELVTGEALWIALRAGVYGCAPLLVSLIFGLDATLGMLIVPFVGMLTGFGFAAFGIFVAGLVQSFDNTSYIVSGVLTPLFMLAGTFFPIDALPEWAQIASNFNPLYHCVELVRHAAFGFEGWADVAHIGGLLLFAALMWRLAVMQLSKRLID
jgi:lipooligosaccharide transport system permease protein